VANPVELSQPAFLIDLHHVEVGWIGFPEGRPDLRLVPLGQEMPPRPSAEYKDGFRVLIKLPEQTAAGHPIRHFSHNSTIVCRAFDALHDAFLASPEAKQGLIPLVQITETEPIKSRQGSTNYAPKFAIVKWLARPVDLDPEQLTPEAAADAPAADADAFDPFPPQADAPAPGNGHRPAPPAAPAGATAAPVEELAF
jgi:hypothetical protein